MPKLQDKKEKLWVKMFQQLLAFKVEYGHTRVPSTFKNKTLSRWVARQRENEAKLPAGRKKKLDAVGFSWYHIMDGSREEIWFDQYEQLKRFHKKHGHYRVPKDHVLRIWVDRQRALEHRMPSSRKVLLDAIKFRWQSKIKTDSLNSWNLMYKELLQYYNNVGDCKVSCHSKKHKRLGSWVTRQRRRWKELDTRKRNKLKELNFFTSEMIEKERRLKWLTMLAILKRYKKENGNCRVPNKYARNYELGRWVEIQRLEEKKMPAWRKEKLSLLGFEWSKDIRDGKEKAWYEMYGKLEKFYQRFKHSSVPELWHEDPKLSLWVRYQRKPKSPLTREKVGLLKMLSFQWNPLAGRPRTRNASGQFVNEI